MKITWKYVIKRLPSYATLSNLLKTYFQCFVPGGYTQAGTCSRVHGSCTRNLKRKKLKKLIYKKAIGLFEIKKTAK